MTVEIIPRLFVAGLGNLPYPTSRHRCVQFCTNHRNHVLNKRVALPKSVGQLAIDGLASRLGIHMSSVRGGISGQATVYVGETLVDLTLFKSSKHHIHLSRLQRNTINSFLRIFNEHIGHIYRPSLPFNRQRTKLHDCPCGFVGPRPGNSFG